MKRGWISMVLLLVSGAAQAHGGHEGGHGLLAGFIHPLTGWDHLLALFAVGVWAARQDGRHSILIPLGFLSVLALGAVIGNAGLPLPLIEGGIAASLLVTGLLVSGFLRLPQGLAFGLAALFALCHGMAHGAEMPALALPSFFVLGMLAASLVLHAAGYFAWRGALRSVHAQRCWRFAGMLISAAGVYALA